MILRYVEIFKAIGEVIRVRGSTQNDVHYPSQQKYYGNY